MGWEILLGAALEAALSPLADVGFGDEVRDLKQRLTKRTEKVRRKAFQRAYRRASETAGEDSLRPLLEHRPFQEAVVTGLLDPEHGFDVRAAAEVWGEQLPSHARALRRFFSALESALLADDTWGPLLERFQELRFRQDVVAQLRQQGLDTPPARLVSQVSAQLYGPGVIAQDHSVVAAGGSVAVHGDVHGDVILVADLSDLRKAIRRHPPAQLLRQSIRRHPPAQLLRQSIRRYLSYVVDRYRYLDLKGMGLSDRVPLRLPLAEMYVPLKARVELPEGETWSRGILLAGRKIPPQEGDSAARLSAPQPVLDLLRQNDGLIVLGDPGAGKTTFLKVLALQLATERGQDLDLGVRLPLLVPLSAYANALAEGDVRLDGFIAGYFHNLGGDLPIGDMLHEALEQGGALVLLDGLDEVQDPALRRTVVERVLRFFTFHRRSGNKFVLTSRIVGYRDVRPVVEGLAECTLVDFKAQEIQDFVSRWTATLERAARGDTPLAAQEAAREEQELLATINDNPGVRELAANPLLLAILALMKRQGVALPERRVELYDQYVRTLLSSWNRARGLGRPPARDLDVVETVRVLAPLALWMHQVNPGAGLVKAADMRRKLVEIFRQRGETDPQRAGRRFLADVRDYASLLLERGAGQYGFIHLIFEEYLAAIGVARLAQLEIAPVLELLEERVGDPAWREVTLLTIGYLGIVQQREQVASQVVRVLTERQPGQPGQAVTMAGQAVADAWPGGVTPACREQVVGALLHTLSDDGRVGAPLRAAAGRTLAALGDPRQQVLLPEAMPFCPVPSGSFWMGTRQEDIPLLVERFGESEYYAYEWETPQHQVTLPAYYIARYPVTNAQFQAFVAVDGYKTHRYWREAEAAGRWTDGRLKLYQLRRAGGEWEAYEVEVEGPQRFGEPFDLPNHPLVGVSWYEALAFTRWLAERLRDAARQRLSEGTLDRMEQSMWQGLAAGRWMVRLPTEAEWEKGARGTDKRWYPWGDEADPNRANYRDTGIGTTSAVGCFPNHSDPNAPADLCGNVWEWTTTAWGQDWEKPEFRYRYDPDDGREDLGTGANVLRVLRGGAFGINLNGVRCAYRFRFRPYFRSRNLGFRVVVSPISRPSAL